MRSVQRVAVATVRQASSKIPDRIVRLSTPAYAHKPVLAPLQQALKEPKTDTDEVVPVKPQIKAGTTSAELLKYDQVIHTGQAWDNEDLRCMRFDEGPKYVNPNIAMHLIAQVPPKAVNARVVACDGGGGALGHPKIFINLDKPGNHTCGYCGLRFCKEGQTNDGTNHTSV